MIDIKVDLLSWFIYLFDEKTSDRVADKSIKSKNILNQHCAEELHKQLIGKFKKCKVCSSFKDNIWGADIADMQLISKYNKGI